MIWALHRWTWQLDGPLYVGAPPAGSLNRTRLYVPARALWGALTAELARAESAVDEAPKYQAVGSAVREQTRLTYLYPAGRTEKGWRAWLPEYREGEGRVWLPEPGTGLRREDIGERRFRRCLLYTRPSTAIDPSKDAADEGSLRETECIQTHWRDDGGLIGPEVAMAGYVFVKDEAMKRRLEGVETLFVGGDTRYGLGRIRRVSFEPADYVFGLPVERGSLTPQVRAGRVLAHAEAASMRGALECLAGWDYQKPGAVQKVAGPLWAPGSETMSLDAASWSLLPGGTWQAVGVT